MSFSCPVPYGMWRRHLDEAMLEQKLSHRPGMVWRPRGANEWLSRILHQVVVQSQLQHIFHRSQRISVYTMKVAYLTLLFLAAAQCVNGNHSTCSWVPLKSYADPPDEGWRKFCTATLQDGGRYACGAHWPGSSAKVADYGVLAHNVLELGEFDLVPNTWECMRLFADQCWAPQKTFQPPRVEKVVTLGARRSGKTVASLQLG